MEKAEVINSFSTSAFTSKTSLWESQPPWLRGKVWSKEDASLVEIRRVREYISRLDKPKSMGPDGMHPWVLRELADVIVKPLSIIFDWSWWLGELPEDWKTANVTCIFKKGRKEDPGDYRLVSLPLMPSKVMEPLILETTSKHIKDKKVITSNQHRFTKGK